MTTLRVCPMKLWFATETLKIDTGGAKRAFPTVQIVTERLGCLFPLVFDFPIYFTAVSMPAVLATA